MNLIVVQIYDYFLKLQPYPPFLAFSSKSPSHNCQCGSHSHPSQKNFLNTLTLYKHYTNDTRRANDKRTLIEV